MPTVLNFGIDRGNPQGYRFQLEDVGKGSIFEFMLSHLYKSQAGLQMKALGLFPLTAVNVRLLRSRSAMVFQGILRCDFSEVLLLQQD
ncbi:hypothetical protein IX84_29580 [Phaeodactylibacter xiamenensis]|uniref:Uncharacterized protein n=1 Tax=Phaeodactylibacter xiamenensis TaxID=1524460 RepID=A0A098RZD0_9BACT|nr:hypothetical protein IX84_29580 [Phaeodactylibacter xiamenensis]